ncbi:hypothetical protein [Hymenobacter daeguensis]
MTTVRLPSIIAPELPAATPAYYEGPRPRLDNTADFYLWQQQVCLALQGLRHVGGSAPAEQPGRSFQHAMRELYGKSYFSAFISSRAWQQAGLAEPVEQQLQRLQQLLNAFEEPDSDDLLATNADWQGILAQAELVAALLLPAPVPAARPQPSGGL